jgi:hypothetical protein
MKRTILILAASLASAPAANAAIDIVQVPAMCGGPGEVFQALAVRMPNPEPIGKGGNSQGTQIATLYTGADGYWALLASTSKDEVCVVASGFNWTAGSSPRSF